MTPAQKVLMEPVDRVQIHVRAKFSDGSVRDVSRLAVYETSNQVAAVTPDGEVQRQELGETTILVRYLDQQATVQLAFVPARPGFVWPEIPESNYIDHHVFAKLRSLRHAALAICAPTACSCAAPIWMPWAYCPRPRRHAPSSPIRVRTSAAA